MQLTPYYEMCLLMNVTYNSFLGGNTGSWYSPENIVVLNLITMSLLMSLLISLGENNNVLIQLSKLVCWLSLLFFGSVELLMLFFLFEVVMMYIYIMIILQGSQPEKMSAVYYALIYTSLFSLPFLTVVLMTSAWPLRTHPSPLMQVVMLGMFMAKSPLYGLHGWLPKAHVEAPTSGSMLLAGLLLKVGLYGAMKFMVLIIGSMHLIFLMSSLGMSLGALLASTSSESKMLAAYSSVCHINLCLYGLSTVSNHLLGGGYLMYLSHGYISLMMFYLVGEMYHYSGSRILYYLSGLLTLSGSVSVISVLVFLSNGGIPPMLSFWAEILIITGIVCFNMSVFVIVVIYFMVGLYYSIYMMVHLNKTGGVLNLTHTVLTPCLWGLLMVANIVAIIN